MRLFFSFLFACVLLTSVIAGDEIDWENREQVQQLSVQDLRAEPQKLKEAIRTGMLSDAQKQQLFTDKATNLQELGLLKEYAVFAKEKFGFSKVAISETLAGGVVVSQRANGFLVKTNKGVVNIDGANLKGAEIEVLTDGRVVINGKVISYEGAANVKVDAGGLAFAGATKLEVSGVLFDSVKGRVFIKGNVIECSEGTHVILPERNTYEVNCPSCFVNLDTRTNVFSEDIPVKGKIVVNPNSVTFFGDAEVKVGINGKSERLAVQGNPTSWSVRFSTSHLEAITYANRVPESGGELLHAINGLGPISVVLDGLRFSSQKGSGNTEFHFAEQCDSAYLDGCISYSLSELAVPSTTKVFSNGKNPQLKINGVRPEGDYKDEVTLLKQKYSTAFAPTAPGIAPFVEKIRVALLERRFSDARLIADAFGGDVGLKEQIQSYIAVYEKVPELSKVPANGVVTSDLPLATLASLATAGSGAVLLAKGAVLGGAGLGGAAALNLAGFTSVYMTSGNRGVGKFTQANGPSTITLQKASGNPETYNFVKQGDSYLYVREGQEWFGGLGTNDALMLEKGGQYYLYSKTGLMSSTVTLRPLTTTVRNGQPEFNIAGKSNWLVDSWQSWYNGDVYSEVR